VFQIFGMHLASAAMHTTNAEHAGKLRGLIGHQRRCPRRCALGDSSDGLATPPKPKVVSLAEIPAAKEARGSHVMPLMPWNRWPGVLLTLVWWNA
jgi:hypothetical protein